MSFAGRSSLHPIHAETRGLSGWIRSDVGSGSGEVRVEAGQLEIPLASLSSQNALYDSELRRRIDIRRHPTANAELSDWQPTERPGSYRVRGDVTFRGVTVDVEDEITVSVQDDETVLLDGSRVFDIRDFGMEPPRLLALRVHPEVTIRIALVARLVD